MKKYCAFTLAEVLITLGIIGIIAAITIPTLQQSKNNGEIQTGVKKAFNTIANATKMAEAQNGTLESWDWLSASLLTDNLAPQLKYAKQCTYSDRTDCIADNYLTLAGNSFPFIDGTDGDYYILQDGSILAMRYSTGAQTGYFSVDINGKKGPNKFGHDVFFFRINSSGVNPDNTSETCEDNQDTGVGCAKKVLIDNDMSYLTKQASAPDCSDPCAGCYNPACGACSCITP